MTVVQSTVSTIPTLPIRPPDFVATSFRIDPQTGIDVHRAWVLILTSDSSVTLVKGLTARLVLSLSPRPAGRRSAAVACVTGCICPSRQGKHLSLTLVAKRGRRYGDARADLGRVATVIVSKTGCVAESMNRKSSIGTERLGDWMGLVYLSPVILDGLRSIFGLPSQVDLIAGSGCALCLSLGSRLVDSPIQDFCTCRWFQRIRRL